MGSRAVTAMCVVCGETAVVATRDPVLVEFRDGRYTVEGFEYERCSACGEEYYRPGQVDAIHARAAEQARADRGLLSADGIRSLRLDLGLTQAGLEGVIGASPGTVGRWERGSVVQPAVADRFLRMLLAHPDWLADAMSVDGAEVVRERRGPYRSRSRIDET